MHKEFSDVNRGWLADKGMQIGMFLLQLGLLNCSWTSALNTNKMFITKETLIH